MRLIQCYDTGMRYFMTRVRDAWVYFGAGAFTAEIFYYVVQR